LFALFYSQLMTGYLSKDVANPLSLMSIRALRDLGYTVDETKAESYAIPSESDVIRAAGAAQAQVLVLGNDMLLPDELDFSRTIG
jgi:hypothetical protein